LPLLVVDAANVVGSVPDGWWRDRRGAALRLRDSLAPLAQSGLVSEHEGLLPPLEVVLVVEGQARGVPSIDEVRVHAAPGSGDDAIVELVRDSDALVKVVVTADRQLRERVRALGADAIGPRAIR
jgi:hypothetical protein